MRHVNTFPINRPSISQSTLASSTESHRDSCESFSNSRLPSNDDISMRTPLLPSRTWATTAIEDEPNPSVDHPPSSHTRMDTSDSKGQQTTRLRREEQNMFRRVPKHIVQNGWTRHLYGSIVHIPALLMTLVVLVVGSREFYWYSEDGALITDYRVDAGTIKNVLQLVAKLHELLIVASLSSIALAMFRRSLITVGVRLGFLTGGYRVGDIAYLKSAAFWRQGVAMSNFWDVLLPGFVFLATVMSTIVGPASAVLLVPTLGWYRFDCSIPSARLSSPPFTCGTGQTSGTLVAMVPRTNVRELKAYIKPLVQQGDFQKYPAGCKISPQRT